MACTYDLCVPIANVDRRWPIMNGLCVPIAYVIERWQQILVFNLPRTRSKGFILIVFVSKLDEDESELTMTGEEASI